MLSMALTLHCFADSQICVRLEAEFHARTSLLALKKSEAVWASTVQAHDPPDMQQEVPWHCVVCTTCVRVLREPREVAPLVLEVHRGSFDDGR